MQLAYYLLFHYMKTVSVLHFLLVSLNFGTGICLPHNSKFQTRSNLNVICVRYSLVMKPC